MNVTPAKNFQRAFFDRLEARFQKRSKMVLAVADLLSIGRDAVYRRLRGDTVLSADELMLLARTFDIRLDDRHPLQADDPRISYPPGMENITSELQYYQLLEAQCLHMAALPDVSIDYATPELPLYYELFTPTLLAFKTFVYGLTTWNFKKWKNLQFQAELIDPEVFRIAKRLVPVLFDLPGRELWSIGILDITLRQIEHAVETGRLNNLVLKEQMFTEIEAIIVHMEAMTRSGKRFPPEDKAQADRPDFEVYQNELSNTSNVVIIKSPVQSLVYATFINPNYLISSDERIQHQMETWFDNLVEGANGLNANSSRSNLRFFASLRRNVAATKARIDTFI
jgi:hypothetical protein